MPHLPPDKMIRKSRQGYQTEAPIKWYIIVAHKTRRRGAKLKAPHTNWRPVKIKGAVLVFQLRIAANHTKVANSTVFFFFFHLPS